MTTGTGFSHKYTSTFATESHLPNCDINNVRHHLNYFAMTSLREAENDLL